MRKQGPGNEIPKAVPWGCQSVLKGNCKKSRETHCFRIMALSWMQREQLWWICSSSGSWIETSDWVPRGCPWPGDINSFWFPAACGKTEQAADFQIISSVLIQFQSTQLSLKPLTVIWKSLAVPCTSVSHLVLSFCLRSNLTMQEWERKTTFFLAPERKITWVKHLLALHSQE